MKRNLRQMLLTLLLSLALLPPCAPGAAAQAFSAAQVKAAFLYNFAKFVEWPGAAFDSADAPFVLGVLGTDPVGAAARELLRGKSIKGRPLVVREVAGPKAARECHLLFFGRDEEDRLEAILDALSGAPVLVVSDVERFTDRGGMIELVTVGQRIRFAIDAAAARAAGLTLSSQLRELALPVRGPAGEAP